MDKKDIFPFLFCMAEEDHCAIVICNLEHEIIYMNPAAVRRYAKSGGNALLGKSLLDCHHAISREKIQKTVRWFQKDRNHNIMYTFCLYGGASR